MKLFFFQGILSDLFSGIKISSNATEAFNQAVEEACVFFNLQRTDYFAMKINQLYEMILVRHGAMIIGPAFGGKTTTYRVLAKALDLMQMKGASNEHKAIYCGKILYNRHAERQKKIKSNHILFDMINFIRKCLVINPRCLSVDELYGKYDAISREWTDGVLAICYRDFAMSTTTDRKWLIFDGPVDPLWIENMNTVLDDSKKLCLVSGENIMLADTMNLIFETTDLANATPATVF